MQHPFVAGEYQDLHPVFRSSNMVVCLAHFMFPTFIYYLEHLHLFSSLTIFSLANRSPLRVRFKLLKFTWGASKQCFATPSKLFLYSTNLKNKIYSYCSLSPMNRASIASGGSRNCGGGTCSTDMLSEKLVRTRPIWETSNSHEMCRFEDDKDDFPVVGSVRIFILLDVHYNWYYTSAIWFVGYTSKSSLK